MNNNKKHENEADYPHEPPNTGRSLHPRSPGIVATAHLLARITENTSEYWPGDTT